MVVYIFTRINNKVVIKATWIKQVKSEKGELCSPLYRGEIK